MKEVSISISRTLRYFQYGECDSSTKQLIIALHGYGQHPMFFLRKLASLQNEQRCIVAPEGLHRFYVQGTSGRVGASWMTKEDRLNDIADNNHYLTKLLSKLNPSQTTEIILLGFSQGTATAVRFFCSTSLRVDRLILWAGSFPPDLPFPENVDRLNSCDLNLVIGDEDEFISRTDVKHIEDLLKEANVTFKLHTFQGKHDLDAATLDNLLETGNN